MKATVKKRRMEDAYLTRDLHSDAPSFNKLSQNETTKNTNIIIIIVIIIIFIYFAQRNVDNEQEGTTITKLFFVHLQ